MPQKEEFMSCGSTWDERTGRREAYSSSVLIAGGYACRRQGVIAALALLVILCATPSKAQVEQADIHIRPRHISEEVKPAVTDPGLKTYTKPIIRDVDVVLVPVTVTDPFNRLVAGLEKEDFEVFEGSQKQQIRHFSAEDAPVSLGVIFDVSGSMADKIDRCRDAVLEFLKTANPEDEFFMVTFADQPELFVDFTQNIDEIQNKLAFIVPQGRTALLDAICLGLNKMRHAKHQKRALLILSDGGDNHSRYTEKEIRGQVKESDVQIYAIGIFDLTPKTLEERQGPFLLNEITDLTGGRAFTIDNPNELADVATKIGIELRNQYVLAYRPTNAVRDGKWRKIKVKLLPPKGLPPLHVYAKTGYYAPQ
jgi:Ca-activated chloride channel family protein